MALLDATLQLGQRVDVKALLPEEFGSEQNPQRAQFAGGDVRVLLADVLSFFQGSVVCSSKSFGS